MNESTEQNHCGLHPGLVVGAGPVGRATAVVEPAGGGGAVRATWGGPVLAAMAANAEAAPVTGDRVGLRYWPDGRITVDAVAPRRTLLARACADGGSRRQVLAANVDTVAVVEASVPGPDRRRISRLVTLARAGGAEPVVLLTKADLAPDADEQAAELRRSSSCPVYVVSAVTGRGLAEVRALLDGGRTLALLGPSGAGRSGLVEALSGPALVRARARRRDTRARRTFDTPELHRVAGGFVIDGPGLRDVGPIGPPGSG